MLKKGTIRTYSNKEVAYEDFNVIVKSLSSEGLDVYIGTDSQVIKNEICIVTCVCFYKQGLSKNRIYYIKNRIPEEKHPTLRARMILEAYTSLEAALELDPLIKSSLTIHLDIGTDMIKNQTAKFSKELQILIKSQGFGCEVKPNSWASSCVADKYTKS